MKRKRGRPRHDDVLTPAEWRTVEAVRHGLTNRAIAERTGTSVDAVKYHLANTFAKLGQSGRAELRAWRGIRRDSALHRKETVMDEPVVSGTLGQISRTVSDVAAATRWYGDVLGLRHLYSFGTLAFFDCGGVRLMLSQDERVANESILYFHVADIRVAHDALAARGVAFTHAPHMVHRHADGTEEWMAVFSDGDGRPLALMCRVQP